VVAVEPTMDQFPILWLWTWLRTNSITFCCTNLDCRSKEFKEV